MDAWIEKGDIQKVNTVVQRQYAVREPGQQSAVEPAGEEHSDTGQAGVGAGTINAYTVVINAHPYCLLEQSLERSHRRGCNAELMRL